MEDCIFCKIIGEDISPHKVYEDDRYIAFFDIRPLNPGHTLVIPKKHYENVWDVEDIGGYFEVVRKIAVAIGKAFDSKYVLSSIIGELVPHAHVHLLPKMPDDGHGDGINFKKVKEYSEDELDGFADKIKGALG